MEFLDLDVSLLYGLAPVRALGETRASVIVAGRHGVVLKRGQASALFLPQVARENNWDSERLLRELCAKAGLPTTAWKQQDTELHVFEGFSIAGEGPGPLPAMPPRYSPQAVAALSDHLGRNLAALVTGAVAMYFMPGGPDGRINGIVVSIRRPTGEDLATACQLDLLKSIPLQSTAHQLVESLAANLRQQRIGVPELIGCKVNVSVFGDPAMHGTVSVADLRGIDPARRALLLNHSGRVSWSFDPAKSPDALLAEARASLPTADPDQTLIFSLAVASNLPAARGAVVPQAAAGANVRPPAVAGTFYPGEPGELLSMVDKMLAVYQGVPSTCSAVMLPHAGYRFSARWRPRPWRRPEFRRP